MEKKPNELFGRPNIKSFFNYYYYKHVYLLGLTREAAWSNVKTTDFKGSPGLSSWLKHLIAMSLWASYFSFL